jgi:DNA polymerase/3'-5' exonuclease PolX
MGHAIIDPIQVPVSTHLQSDPPANSKPAADQQPPTMKSAPTHQAAHPHSQNPPLATDEDGGEDKVEAIIQMLERMSSVASASREPSSHFKMRAYESTILLFKSFAKIPGRPMITSAHQLKLLVHDPAQAGPLTAINTKGKTFDKIEEFLNQGSLRRLNAFDNDPFQQAVAEVSSVWGLGPTSADALVRNGFTTVESLRTPAGLAALNDAQRTGLKYHDEMHGKRVPREEIAEAVEIVRIVAADLLQTDAGLIVQGVGSFRRGKLTSGDLDILISHTDGRSHVGLLGRVVARLMEDGRIVDKLSFDARKEAEPRKKAKEAERMKHVSPYLP